MGDTMTADEARGLLAAHEITGQGNTQSARALRAVIALHEAVASRDRHAAFYMRQAWAVGVDATRRADALALREALPDVWERLRSAPEPEYPGDAGALHVPPLGAGPAEWDSRAAAKRAAGLGDATWCGVAEGTGVVVVHDGPAQPREGG